MTLEQKLEKLEKEYDDMVKAYESKTQRLEKIILDISKKGVGKSGLQEVSNTILQVASSLCTSLQSGDPDEIVQCKSTPKKEILAMIARVDNQNDYQLRLSRQLKDAYDKLTK